MTAATGTLIFVYNADGGVFAAVSDAVHKVLSPATYACSLCMVSYGAFGMRREWRAFLESLPHAKVFHHRDDFRATYPALDIALPAILWADTGGAPQLLVSAETLDRQKDVTMLITTVRDRLATIGDQDWHQRPILGRIF